MNSIVTLVIRMKELLTDERRQLLKEICLEMTHHLGYSDDELAGSIVDVWEKNFTFDQLKCSLRNTHMDFPDPCIVSMLRLIQRHVSKAERRAIKETAADNHDNVFASFVPSAVSVQPQKKSFKDYLEETKGTKVILVDPPNSRPSTNGRCDLTKQKDASYNRNSVDRTNTRTERIKMDKVGSQRKICTKDHDTVESQLPLKRDPDLLSSVVRDRAERDRYRPVYEVGRYTEERRSSSFERLMYSQKKPRADRGVRRHESEREHDGKTSWSFGSSHRYQNYKNETGSSAPDRKESREQRRSSSFERLVYLAKSSSREPDRRQTKVEVDRRKTVRRNSRPRSSFGRHAPATEGESEYRKRARSPSFERGSPSHRVRRKSLLTARRAPSECDLEDGEVVDVEVRRRTPVETPSDASVYDPLKSMLNLNGTLAKAAMFQELLSEKRRTALQDAKLEHNIRHIPVQMRLIGQAVSGTSSDDEGADYVEAVRMGQHVDSEFKRRLTDEEKACYGRPKQDQPPDPSLLPLFEDYLMTAIREQPVVLVLGTCNSGQIAEVLVSKAEDIPFGRIVCASPKRVAVIQLAAQLENRAVGINVGYSTRYEEKSAKSAMVKFASDTFLLRELLADSELKDYSMVIVDEVYYRTSATDVLCAALKQLLTRRTDLKVILIANSSARPKLAAFFSTAPVIDMNCVVQPVGIFYSPKPEIDYLEGAMAVIKHVHTTEANGDILVFLPSKEDVDLMGDVLSKKLDTALSPAGSTMLVLPLYTAAPTHTTTPVFETTSQNRRKVLLSAGHCGVALQVANIRFVVDAGLSRMKVFSASTGEDGVYLMAISQAEAMERAGRAGVGGEGKCFRLYTQNAYKTEMPAASVPEILRTDATTVVLWLAALNLNVGDLIDPLSTESLALARQRLVLLHALDQDGNLTDVGRRMAALPVDAYLAKMLTMSGELGCVEEIATITSMLTIGPVFLEPKERRDFVERKKIQLRHTEGDHLTLLEIYNTWKKKDYSAGWCKENYIRYNGLKRAKDMRSSLVDILKRQQIATSRTTNLVSCIKKAICGASIHHVCRQQATNEYRNLLTNHVVLLERSSSVVLSQSEWMVYHGLIQRTKDYTNYAISVDPVWLVQFAPQLYQIVEQSPKIQKCVERYSLSSNRDIRSANRAFRGS